MQIKIDLNNSIDFQSDIYEMIKINIELYA